MAAKGKDIMDGKDIDLEFAEQAIPDLLIVNCAACRRTLAGRGEHAHHAGAPVKLPPEVAGRHRGRPYCRVCLELVRAGYGAKGLN